MVASKVDKLATPMAEYLADLSAVLKADMLAVVLVARRVVS